MGLENKNYERVEVKEEIQDATFIETDVSNSSYQFIKIECKQEINCNYSVKDEHNAYDENLSSWINVEINSTNCYRRKLFQCPKCSVKTKYEANLNKHISFMHPENKPPCDRQVQYKTGHNQNKVPLQAAGNNDNLLTPNKHLDQNHKHVYSKERFSKNHILLKKRKPKFSCMQCSFQSNFKNVLINHVYECHYSNKSLQREKLESDWSDWRKENYLQCDHCLIFFRKKANLRKHIRSNHFKDGVLRHDSKDQKMLPPCPKCGKRYQHSVFLSRHIVTCGKKGVLQCGTCQFSTNYESNIVTHTLNHLRKSNLCLNLTYGNRK